VLIFSSGRVIIFLRKKIFLTWIGLEINMFGLIAILYSCNTQTTGNLKLFLYLIIQTLGSLIIVGGFIFLKEFFLVLGILLKMGVFPFIMWVPSVFSVLGWGGFWFCLVVRKFPMLYLVVKWVDLGIFYGFFLFIIFFSLVGMFSTSGIKLFLCWSSIANTGFIIILINWKVYQGFVYYFLYAFGMLLACYYFQTRGLDYKSSSNVKVSSNRLKKYFMGKACFLIFAGFPPLFGFLRKLQIGEVAINISKFNFHGEYLKNFENLFLFLFLFLLIILKVLAYLKFFLKKINNFKIRSIKVSRLIRLILMSAFLMKMLVKM